MRLGMVDTFENILLLCPTHHVMVDANDGVGYTVGDLVDIKRSHEESIQKDERLDQIIDSYLVGAYRDDNKVLFEAVDLNGPSVDSMFIDVPMAAPTTSAAGQVLEVVSRAHPGDLESRADADGLAVAGAAQTLLHPTWGGNALIQGGPGQGKSTLLQFVCQFHRARQLEGKSDEYTGTDQNLTPITNVERLPFKIDLRRYAAWRRETAKHATKGKRRKKPDRDARPAHHLERYIAEQVASLVGRDFDVEDLAKVVTTRPVLLALDGLDEVADLTDRDDVGEEIVRAADRLQNAAADITILVASRPGATTSSLWDGTTFPVFTLRTLSTGLRVQYLQRWCRQAKVSPPRAAELQEKLLDHQDKPHVRELGSNPMQLAILLHLLYRKGLLPQQRTDLYHEYIETFLDREEVDKEPLLRDHRDLIVQIHRVIAWHLQTEAEMNRGSGTLTRIDLEHLITTHVADNAEQLALADRIFKALTSRMLCLVERRTDQFEFEVQSLREYFVAMHIFEESPPKGTKNSRDDCLNALLERPYWSNVTRFFVGKLSNGELRSLVDNIRSRATTTDARLDPHLRWTASQLLDDQVFRTLSDKYVGAAVDFILEGSGAVLAEDGLLDKSGAPLLIKVPNARNNVASHVRERLNTEPDSTMRSLLVSLLRRHIQPEALRDHLWDTVGARLELPDALDLLAEARALHDLDDVRSQQLIELINARFPTALPTGAPVAGGADSPARVSLADLLTNGAYDGTDQHILGACLAEIAAATTVPFNPHEQDVQGPATALTRLRQAGSLALIRDQDPHAQRLLETLSNTDRSAGRTRTRGGRPTTVSAVTLPYLRAIAAVNADWSNSTAWFDLLQRAQALWGDQALVRQLLVLVPESVDVALGANPDPSRDAALRDRAAWIQASRDNARNPAWWEVQVPSFEDELHQYNWVLCLLTTARTDVLKAQCENLNQIVAALDTTTLRSLVYAVQQLDAAGAAHRSNLRESLRLRLVKPSAESAVLIAQSSAQPAHEFLRVSVAAQSLDLLRTNRLPVNAVQTLTRGAEHLTAESVRGLRLELSAAPTPIVVSRPSKDAAKAVLQEPVRYPAEVVRSAARLVSERRAKRLKPLLAVAERDRWFAQ